MPIASLPVMHPLAGPSLPTNIPITIKTADGFARVDNSSSPAYPGSGMGSSPAEQFRAYDPSNPTNASETIAPGEPTILRSELTGQYCRLAPLPSNSTQIGMLCDQPTPATATPLIYTGSGLTSTSGVPLVSSGPGQPLLLANTTTRPANATAESMLITPVGENHTCDGDEGCSQLHTVHIAGQGDQGWGPIAQWQLTLL